MLVGRRSSESVFPQVTWLPLPGSDHVLLDLRGSKTRLSRARSIRLCSIRLLDATLTLKDLPYMRTTARAIVNRARRLPMALAARTFALAKVFVRHGPRGVVQYVRLSMAPRVIPAIFANGLTTDPGITAVRRWHLIHSKPIVIALTGEARPGLAQWITDMRRALHCHFLLSPAAALHVEGVDPAFYTVCDFLQGEKASFVDLREWLFQHWRSCDVLILDADQPFVDSTVAIRLQHAAYAYESPASEIGFVTAGLNVDGVEYAGWEWDRASAAWSAPQPHPADYGQGVIARYVLAANVHGFYSTTLALERVPMTLREVEGLSFSDQLNRMVAMGWRQNVRTLAYPSVSLVSSAPVVPRSTSFDRKWLTDRHVTDFEGRRRIIFVLPATSISGGIKTVFEQADGLLSRGFAVEIWSLQGAPAWMSSNVGVKTYRTYFDLIAALRNEEAIKVATWWESAQAVWLASVNTGIPAFYIQEFETWFYPNDKIGQAAVASSYRKEFASLTIADFQKAELAELGVEARTVHSGYDSSNFKVLDTITRRDDTLMAVGRSFFQKNFAMTERAWRSLGNSRPRFLLYGFEPDLVADDLVAYEERPSNERVNELYNEATCFVQTSFHEGFSLPIIEAMAAGCPVITTDSHGNRDFCRDGENCIMVEQNDVEGLASAISLVMGDQDLQQRLRSAGLQTAKLHTWTVILDQLQDFYEQVA